MAFPQDSQQLALLFVTGDRINLDLDSQLLEECGFDSSSSAQFRVGDLRQHIFEQWQALMGQRERHGSESLEDVTGRPASPECIQLFHLGQRLDPNGLVSDLNFKTSHVLHVVLKQPEAHKEPAQGKKRLDRLASQFMRPKPGARRRGSTSNAPVPAFVSSAATREGTATRESVANRASLESVGKSTIIDEEPGDTRPEPEGSLERTGDINGSSDPVGSGSGSDHGPNASKSSVPILRPSAPTPPSDIVPKKAGGCCIIM